MQALTALFLKEELPEIKEAASKFDTVEILTETAIHNSDLIKVTMLVLDPSMLVTIGLQMSSNRMMKNINKLNPL